MKNSPIEGACHCGNLSFKLSTDVPRLEVIARACDCKFCRFHGAKNWSDPSGETTIRVADAKLLQKYRFGLRTADFYICRKCGCYLGAVLSAAERKWSTVNLRLSDIEVMEDVASYGKEGVPDRVSRRKRVWTPTDIVGV